MTASVLFLLSAAFVVYVIFGYPLILGLLARLRPKPVAKTLDLRTVSILIAVRDGAPWLRNKLNSILLLDYPLDLLQIIVVSDGSMDGTDEIVRDFAGRGVELLRISPSGKSAAITSGMERARHEILLLTDVRQELEPGSLRRLVAGFGDPCVGVVSGTLVILDP